MEMDYANQCDFKCIYPLLSIAVYETQNKYYTKRKMKQTRKKVTEPDNNESILYNE